MKIILISLIDSTLLFAKHKRIVHEGLSFPFTGAERGRRLRERKRSLYSEEVLESMEKLRNQKRNADLKAKRLADKEFDEKYRKETRERKRRLRERKALEEALVAIKVDNNI